MIIYVFQHEAKDFTPSESGEVVTVDFEVPVANMVTYIQKIAPPGPSIECLHLVCHGNAGFLMLASGIAVQNTYRFRPLRGRFHPEGRGIEIHACAVGSGTPITDGGQPPRERRPGPGQGGGQLPAHRSLRGDCDGRVSRREVEEHRRPRALGECFVRPRGVERLSRAPVIFPARISVKIVGRRVD